MSSLILLSKLYKKSIGTQNFFSEIKKYKNINILERGLLVRLIDKIYILEDKKIEIHFNYDETIDVFDKLNCYANKNLEKIREVV